ncbi:hypothetical protein AAA533_24625 [Pseudomonas aeruginosa]|uniref:hypothetical protein n=1 Tax=Pseudomonas aeruginosa TaxID=287 RepID=UPI001CBF49FA|nr:hypothetical protein [Pseudomonas aeruginosa]MCT5886109.1 hypothetical protein [Pseudomonas aeruginosa]MDX3944261.1 hypothetical protein [Pseudomonas aeruginosa]
MKLIQCRLCSGQRVPLLVQDGAAAPLPVLVPFLYVQLQLKHRAVNTAAAHLRAIQAFYVYAEGRGLDVDEAILQCRFESRPCWTVTPFGCWAVDESTMWPAGLVLLIRHCSPGSICAPVTSTCAS